MPTSRPAPTSAPARAARLAVAGLLLATGAQAQNVVDQSQPLNDVPYSYTNGGWTGQSFTTAAANISGAGLNVLNPAGSGVTSTTFTVHLWNGDPSAGGTTLLASQDVAVTLAENEYAWVDAFWAPVATTPGTQYWFTAYAAGPLITRASGDVYAGGRSYYNYSTDPRDAYTFGAGYDIAFRTYTSLGEVSTVPEPATVALMGGGLALLGVGTRLRRRREG